MSDNQKVAGVIKSTIETLRDQWYLHAPENKSLYQITIIIITTNTTNSIKDSMSVSFLTCNS